MDFEPFLNFHRALRHIPICIFVYWTKGSAIGRVPLLMDFLFVFKSKKAVKYVVVVDHIVQAGYATP